MSSPAAGVRGGGAALRGLGRPASSGVRVDGGAATGSGRRSLVSLPASAGSLLAATVASLGEPAVATAGAPGWDGSATVPAAGVVLKSLAGRLRAGSGALVGGVPGAVDAAGGSASGTAPGSGTPVSTGEDPGAGGGCSPPVGSVVAGQPEMSGVWLCATPDAGPGTAGAGAPATPVPGGGAAGPLPPALTAVPATAGRRKRAASRAVASVGS